MKDEQSVPVVKKKTQISVVDFLPYYGKYPVGVKDKNGKDICYGHTVLHQGERHLVGYRYETTMLKIPHTIFYTELKGQHNVEILNIVTAAEEYLIIGYDYEPFIQKLAKEVEIV